MNKISARQIATLAIDAIKLNASSLSSDGIKACHISTAARRWARSECTAFGARSLSTYEDVRSVIFTIFVNPVFINGGDISVVSASKDINTILKIVCESLGIIPAVESTPAVESDQDDGHIITTDELFAACPNLRKLEIKAPAASVDTFDPTPAYLQVVSGYDDVMVNPYCTVPSIEARLLEVCDTPRDVMMRRLKASDWVRDHVKADYIDVYHDGGTTQYTALVRLHDVHRFVMIALGCELACNRTDAKMAELSAIADQVTLRKGDLPDSDFHKAQAPAVENTPEATTSVY